MSDEIAMAVAYALVAKAAEVTVAGTKNALNALYRLIRDRFGRGEGGAATVHALTGNGRELALAGALSRAMADDPEFERLLRLHWERARRELAETEGTVVNFFGGTAGKVVQAGVISGDVHL